MKRKRSRKNSGFTLIEVVTAITVLGIVAAPVGGALVFSVRLNNYADRLMQARLAVSSAAETLMAEGVEPGVDYDSRSDFAGVDVALSGSGAVYDVKISSEDKNRDGTPMITIDTRIRKKGVGEA